MTDQSRIRSDLRGFAWQYDEEPSTISKESVAHCIDALCVPTASESSGSRANKYAAKRRREAKYNKYVRVNTLAVIKKIGKRRAVSVNKT